MADVTETDLGSALERVASWLRRATPPSEWSAVALSSLDALARGGPQRVGDLARQERITQPGMTGLVGRLAAAGLVERGSDVRDGRATLVTVTVAGRKHLRDLHERRARTVATHVATLPAPARRALFDAAGALELLSAQPVSPPLPAALRPAAAEDPW